MFGAGVLTTGDFCCCRVFFAGVVSCWCFFGAGACIAGDLIAGSGTPNPREPQNPMWEGGATREPENLIREPKIKSCQRISLVGISRSAASRPFRAQRERTQSGVVLCSTREVDSCVLDALGMMPLYHIAGISVPWRKLQLNHEMARHGKIAFRFGL